VPNQNDVTVAERGGVERTTPKRHWRYCIDPRARQDEQEGCVHPHRASLNTADPTIESKLANSMIFGK
jgi:hypothetical protein